MPRAWALALVVALAAGCAAEPGPAPSPAPTPSTTKPPPSVPSAATPTPTPAEPQQCFSQKTATRAGTPVWLLNTTYGDVRIRLHCDKVPLTAQNIVTLTERSFYDGILFHRVVSGFVVQAGDPQTRNESLRSRWGTGGAGYTIEDEFACNDGSVSHDLPPFCPSGVALHHDRAGVVSMANSGQPRSGSSQFFITLAATPELDRKHPIFGEVADPESLEVVLAIGKAPTNKPYADTPRSAILIERAAIEWS